MHFDRVPEPWALAEEKKLHSQCKTWDAVAPCDVRGLRIAEEIPIIDLGPYLRGEPHGLETAAAELKRACEEVGFYHITGFTSILSDDLIDKAFIASERFFALPEDAKFELELNTKPAAILPRNTGYTPSGARLMPAREKGNLIEAFIISNHAEAVAAAARKAISAGMCLPMPLKLVDGCTDTSAPLEAPELPWPIQLGHEWRMLMMEYVLALEMLSKKLLAALAVAAGMSKEYFDAALAQGPLWRMRLCAYPADLQATAAGSYGIAPHVDTSLVTIVAIREAESPGLALHCEELGGWIRAPLRPGALLVNTGTVLQSISNDKWQAARHYVGNPSASETRRSLAFFLNAAPTYRMPVIPSFVMPSCSAKYEPTSWLEGFGRNRGGFFRLAGQRDASCSVAQQQKGVVHHFVL